MEQPTSQGSKKAPQKHLITDDYIRNRARPAKGSVIDFDSDTKGLAVRFTSAQEATFLFCYGSKLAGGSQRRMVIGKWTPTTGKATASVVRDMRKRAAELRVLVMAKRDPYAEQLADAEAMEHARAAEIAERQRIAAEADAALRAEAARLTVRQLCAHYLDPDDGVKLAPATKRAIERRFERYLYPAWGERKADTITKRDVLALLKPVRQARKRAEVVHVLSAVSGLFSWAVAHDDLPDIKENPAKGVKAMLQKNDELPLERERALQTANEYRAFWDVTDPTFRHPGIESMHADVSACLRLMMFTGARPSEAAGLKWSEVDMESEIWNKPKMGEGRSKSNRGDSLPLVAPVMAILRARQGNGSEFVFPSGRTRRLINGGGEGRLTSNRLATGLRDAIPYLESRQVEPFTPHDVRRTMATGMNEIGVSSDVVERTLNHAMPKLKKTYDKSSKTRVRRRAMDAWVRYFEEVLRTGKTIDQWEDEALPVTDNIIQFPRAGGF